MGKTAGGLLQEQETEQTRRKQAERKAPPHDNQVAPRAGRTGGLGARAERPSEGSRRNTAAVPQVGRGGKAPSAAAAPGQAASAAEPQRGRQSKKKNKGSSDEDLPQAARDATM
ncbi:MAG TPA: hypothetical protein VGD76_11260 [Ramlibacter sp.]